ncbi:HAMP domain-containing sensor histidine kinase [Fodinibius sp.]|uniref:sensor histidine kinase n=1 Tax=Fodinibius sp. TaxID=1872440 RepID=UPI002ACDD8F4|nr:HAMP domain-containing sensor histidine kinase [Fodinibius sp.]MDZ7658851.1 HAMP domain-containing sensor histidine kinase [Fodinibius sp.]
MKRFGSLQWILLAAGIIAILGLTGMNVYSLYALHENTLESSRENKKLHIAEFTDKIRYRFFKKFIGLGSVDINRLQEQYKSTGQFTPEVTKLLNKAAKDSIYSDIYFIPSGSDACQQQKSILQYGSNNKFQPTSNYSTVVCDGMGIARTQIKSLLGDYQYNNKVLFDSHRSITIVLIDPSEQEVFGYLTMPFNQDFLRNSYLPKVLAQKFGAEEHPGMNVWLRDWTNNEIIASSNPDATYDREQIQFVQNFPDFFDYWKVEVSFTDASTVAASNASLIKNFIVLGAAMLLLLGSLVFMFRSAQKERALAERQADFLANVTHELKTPLSVMQAAGENLADGRVQDQQRLKNYGSHIFSEAVRLRKMIDKLLDVAKANAGESLVEPQPTDIGKVAKSYLDKHQKFFRDKDVTLDIDIDKNLPAVNIDQNSLETILSNLIDNAIKYSTDEKYLGIRVFKQNDYIKLCIEDHGIGITPKNLSNIFTKFFRVEDSLTAKTKGHGLGLSIVKNLVELNSGSIEVESEPGDGSTFIITFPILSASDQMASPNSVSTESETESRNKELEEHVS